MLTRTSINFRQWAMLGTALSLVACGEAREQQARCTAAINQAQASLEDDEIDGVPVDLSKAREDIAAVRTVCPEKQLYLADRLEKTLAIREKARRQLVERQAEEAARTKSEPLVGFVAWGAKHRDGAGKAVAKPDCHPRTDPSFGFCDGSVREGGADYAVRYWKDAPAAVRFSSHVPTAVRCDDLGLHRVVRSWKSADGTTRSHCEIYGGVLEGLWALVSVTSDLQSDVVVFSREYLTHDPELREVLGREGR